MCACHIQGELGRIWYSYSCSCLCHQNTSKRNRSHTQTHDKNNTTNDHTKNHSPHLITIEGGAATVRTTSHTRVDGRAEVSVGGRVVNTYSRRSLRGALCA